MKKEETIQIFFDLVISVVNYVKLYGDTIEDKKNQTKGVKESSIEI